MTQPPPQLSLAQARRAAQVLSSCNRSEAVRLNRHFGLPYLHLGQDRYARLPDLIQTLGTDVALALYTDRRGLTGWRGFALHTSLITVTLIIAADPRSPLLPAPDATLEHLRALAERVAEEYRTHPPAAPWQITADRAARLTLRYFPALVDFSNPDTRIDPDDAAWLLRTLPVVCAVGYPPLLNQPDTAMMRRMLHSALGASMNVIRRALRDVQTSAPAPSRTHP